MSSGRYLCLRGLETVYNLRFKEFRPLDAGGPLTIAALDAGQIDVGLLFTTDANIEAKGYVLLQDNKQWQLAENIVPVVRNQKLAQGDDLKNVINDVTASSTSLEELITMNKANDVGPAEPGQRRQRLAEEPAPYPVILMCIPNSLVVWIWRFYWTDHHPLSVHCDRVSHCNPGC